MVNRFVGGMLLAMALGSVACSSSESTSSSGPAVDTHPAWLVGRFNAASIDPYGTPHSEVIDLDADGSATQTFQTFYGQDLDDADEHYIDWSFDGTTLNLGGVSYAVQATASCKTVQLTYVDDSIDTIYEHSQKDDIILGCPTTPAPLTAGEAAFVGTWKQSEAPDALLFLSADREMELLPDDEVWTALRFAFAIDADGTLHGTLPDGTEAFTATIAPAVQGRIDLCTSKKKCFRFAPYHD